MFATPGVSRMVQETTAESCRTEKAMGRPAVAWLAEQGSSLQLCVEVFSLVSSLYFCLSAQTGSSLKRQVFLFLQCCDLFGNPKHCPP